MVAPTDYPRPTVPNPTPGIEPQPPGTKPKPNPPAPKPSAPKPPDAKVIAEKLAAGQALKAGEAIRSANGQYELEMQKDGNLVLYDAANGKALWSSDTAGSGAQIAKLGTDGNLQVLNGDHAVWSSNTTGPNIESLTPQDDGNLVINANTATVGKPPKETSVWSSKTAALSVTVAGQDGSKQTPAVPTIQTPAVSFAPGSPELGIQTFTIHCPASSTGSAWSIFEKDGVKGLPGTLNQNLAATPYLDRQAFGTRPANPNDAVYKIPGGQQVTVLDKTRLQYLEQQRSQLADVEHAKNDDDKANQTVKLVGSIEDELDYAGTQQAVPDVDALAKTISARAPGDKDFQQAVQSGVELYKARLQSQGRTQDQIGLIQQAAAKKDWNQVTQLTARQVANSVGKDTGSNALGDMMGRGSVYATYAGGDPKFAQAVKAGVAQAQQQVLVTDPVNQVDAALKQHGGAAAMALLNKITDPKTALPGQVAQIMSDKTLQADIKQSLEKADWRDDSSKQMMNDLASACQHSVEADSGEVGAGTQAVKDIAANVVPLYDKMNAQPQLMEDAPAGTQLFTNLASSGNVALVLAVASKAGELGRPDVQTSAIDGARIGIDRFSAHSKDLKSKTEEDAAFFSYGFHDFGGNSTPEQQSQYLQKMLQQNPKEAKKLNDDGLADIDQDEDLSGIRTAVAAFSPDLNGVEGFNNNVGNERFANPTLHTSSKSVLTALNDSPQIESSNAAATGPSSGTTPTNMLWLMRSTRNAAWQAGKVYLGLRPDTISNLSKSNIIPDAVKSKLFTKDGAAASWVVNLAERFNKGVSGSLFLANGQFLMGALAGEPRNIGNLIQDGSYIGPHLFFGATQSLNAVLPGSMETVRPYSGNTALQKLISGQQDRILASGLNDSVKTALNGVLGTMAKDTVDGLYLGVDTTNAIYYYTQGGSAGNYIRASGDTISALGDAAFLTGAAVDAGVLGADGAFLGIGAGAIGWTGVGAALMLVGAGIYTIGNAEAHSHKFDGADKALLEAMGVHSDVAEQLAKHAFSFSKFPPSAGGFFTDIFKDPQDMVNWFNTLTPDQADSIATDVKSLAPKFKDDPAAAIKWFQDDLQFWDVKPPPASQLATG
jgi:hypothetical protein